MVVLHDGIVDVLDRYPETCQTKRKFNIFELEKFRIKGVRHDQVLLKPAGSRVQEVYSLIVQHPLEATFQFALDQPSQERLLARDESSNRHGRNTPQQGSRQFLDPVAVRGTVGIEEEDDTPTRL